MRQKAAAENRAGTGRRLRGREERNGKKRNLDGRGAEGKREKEENRGKRNRGKRNGEERNRGKKNAEKKSSGGRSAEDRERGKSRLKGREEGKDRIFAASALRAFQSGGCSAFSWETADGKRLFGRNLDFNRLAEGTGVTYLPQKTKIYTYGTSLENTLREDTKTETAFAAVGIGTLLLGSTPALYEGINEKGLMGAQLYYRGFAHFEEKEQRGRRPVQPPFLVTYLLGSCGSVSEAVRELEERICLSGRPMLGMVPTLHWIFSDRSGETVIAEPDRDGLHIYRNTMGVMTNSPGYPWHRTNLLNYAGLRELDYDALSINGDMLPQCFSGSGMRGLPGDWSSPSRFVRLSFLKQFCEKGNSEAEGVARMFRIFAGVAFPLGMVKVSEPGTVTEYDRGVTEFDYTVYTCVMCAESLRFYWLTYENSRIRYVDLNELMEGAGEAGTGNLLQFELSMAPEFESCAPVRPS